MLILAQKPQGNNIIRWEQNPETGIVDQVLYKFEEGNLMELDRKSNVMPPKNPIVPGSNAFSDFLRNTGPSNFNLQGTDSSGLLQLLRGLL